MSDLVLVCERRGPGGGARGPEGGARAAAYSAASVRRAALLLAPPEITPHEPLVADSGGVLVAIANPQPEGVRLRGGDAGAAAQASSAGPKPGRDDGACVGVLFGEPAAWWRVGGAAPDGTCALARWDERAVELLTDACATRTLWYAQTEDAFLASTSQRALVALLGDFELLPEAVSWMLSAGHLGPEVSWDARLRRLPPNARLTLDRASWTHAVTEERLEWAPLAGDRASHIARVQTALGSVCAALDLDLERWPLALSGGVDSRVLLAELVRQGRRPRCLTWSTRASLRNPLSDVTIARVITRRFGVEHEVVVLDPDPGGVEAAVNRFVAANEGRNAEYAGYVDGMALWRHLFDAGVTGVLRGDEAYGAAYHPATHENTRRGVGGAMVRDYPEGHLVRTLELASQTWPERLQPRADEDPLRFRARMIGQAYNAIQAAGLNGIKARYVEIANPHLSRRVLDSVRALPPEVLRGKATLYALSRAAAPYIPTARFSSTQSMPEILASPAMLELMVGELAGARVARVLAGDGALRVLAALVAAGETTPTLEAHLKRALKKAMVPLPATLVMRLKPPWKGPEPLPASRLAFRVLLASRTVALLEEDARALRD